jgi:AraC-like DNA-binding protein
MMERRRMVELLESLAKEEGISPSFLREVSFMRVSQTLPRKPVTYDPSIVIVAQGRKRGYVGGQTFTYDPDNYLVLSVPLPFECETEATEGNSFLALSIRIEPASLAELLLAMDEQSSFPGEAVPQGFYATPLTTELVSAAVRLLESLKSPLDSRILGPQLVRETVYRVLCGEQGGALRALASRYSRFTQITRVLKRLHAEYSNKLDIRSLAAEANMSPSTFHHNFKAVTAVSPLQYLKSVRLHKARMLIAQDGLNAGVAAAKVGYESPSQFSREFKRFFGNSPANEIPRMR